MVENGGGGRTERRGNVWKRADRHHHPLDFFFFGRMMEYDALSWT